MRKKLVILAFALATSAASALSPAVASGPPICPASNEHVVLCPTGPICCPNGIMCDCP